MHIFRLLLGLFLIALLVPQTPLTNNNPNNWLLRELYNSGNFGTFFEVRRRLRIVTVSSIILFLVSLVFIWPIFGI